MSDTQNASLVICGVGIKTISHMTDEALLHIKQAKKVLYLLNDPLCKEWVEELNDNCESLDSLYFQSEKRIDNYKVIAEYVVQQAEEHKEVVFLMYGHPTFLATPVSMALEFSKEIGVSTTVLPAVSAEDCLFADLGVDPGAGGYQGYEATEFLLRKKIIDPTSHTILWQIGVIGLQSTAEAHRKKSERTLNILKDYLLTFFEGSHKVTLYEASIYPGYAPIIVETALSKLQELEVSPISTLYIPPIAQRNSDKIIIKKLFL